VNNDVGQGIAPEIASQLRAALAKHFVLFLRGQHISPQQEVEYARIYGTPEALSGYGGSALDSTTSRLPAEIMQITNDPKNPASKRQKGTARWHTDLTWSKLPSKAACSAFRWRSHAARSP